MKKILLTVLMSFVSLSSLAWADEKTCPSQNSGPVATAHGVYVKTEWGDMPWTTIKEETGREIVVMCSEEDMEKYFGKIGQKVRVISDMIQFYNEVNGHCYTSVIACSYKGAWHLSFPKPY